MHTRLHRQPGQNGSKALARKYGERFACVQHQHQHDTQNLQRHKASELIEKIIPRRSRDSHEAHLIQRATDESAFVKIAYQEWALREKIPRAGVYWQPEKLGHCLIAQQPHWDCSSESSEYIDMDDYISSIGYMSSNWRYT